ncbi:hypothetical protein BJX68DRAFT_242988 [Aspergillus pseudodeflectus]|uniref:F-box domain-containing protein n=1 Tax=Aspergillus pseudodeflectus TaxID=176178 RepID=A0ABR4JWQ5_9EURO
MDRLQRLPTELLSRIVSLILESAWGAGDEPPSDRASPEERRALYNVCLVSRQLRAVAQPFMFRYLEVSDREDAYPDGGLVQTHIQLLMRFTIALCLNPDLGKHVRFVELDSFAKPGPRNTTALGSDFHTVLGAALGELPLHDRERQSWRYALRQCDLSIPMALIAIKAPNLRVVRFNHGHGILERLSTLRESCPSLLSRLEQLHLTLSDHTETGYNIAQYTPLLTLPSLREFSFEDADLYGKNCPSAWKPGTLETQDIDLAHCHCDASGVEKLLRACKKVTGFTFQTLASHADSFNPRGRGPYEPNAGDIHAALLPHKETLQFLQLDLWRKATLLVSIEGYQTFCSSRVKLPSLRDFPLLEFVEIQHALLPEAPQFSPALKLLHITDCNSSIRNMVGNIAADCKNGRYPKFERFRVSALDITRPIKLPGQRIPQGQTPEQCFRSLSAVFEGTSVDFQIVPHSVEMDDGDTVFTSDSDSDSEYDNDGDFEEAFPYPFINAAGPDIPAMTMMMQQAMQDPALAAALMAFDGDSDHSWETADEL